MMMSVEKWANKKGYNRFYVDSLHSTIGFYKSCGFSVDPDHEEFVECGGTVPMIKEPKNTFDHS